MNKWLVSALILMSVSVAGTAAAAGDATAGKAKAASCAACHGADGNSANPEWPKLAGQHESYLVRQLQNFKGEGGAVRENATMAPMAAPLSDQDIQDVSAYFASQTISAGKADPELVELGEKIYRGGNSATGVAACMACHGPSGEGNPAAKFPALAGQHAKYTEIQLQAFASGARANDAGKMMRGVASKMTAKEMAAVASYIQGLN